MIYTVGTIFFLVRRRWRPLPVNLLESLSSVIKMLPLGSRYFALQFSWAFLLNVPTVIVSTAVGTVDAALYGLIQKLFGLMLQLYQSVTNPLWAGYSDASSRNDWAWCHATFWRSLIVTLVVFCATTMFMIFAGNYVLALLGGAKYEATPWLFFSFGLLATILAIASVGASLQVALGKINLILVTTVSLSLIASPYLAFLAKSSGLQAIVSGSISLWLALALIVLCQGKHILDQNFRNSVHKNL
jgi:O-antigen/teichoic acid export membrane protein